MGANLLKFKLMASLAVFLWATFLFQPQVFSNSVVGSTVYLFGNLADLGPRAVLEFDPFGYFPFVTNILYLPLLFTHPSTWGWMANLISLSFTFGTTHFFAARAFRDVVSSDDLRVLSSLFVSLFLVGFEGREAVNVTVLSIFPIIGVCLLALSRIGSGQDRARFEKLSWLTVLLAASKPVVVSAAPLVALATLVRGYRHIGWLTILMFSVSTILASNSEDRPPQVAPIESRLQAGLFLFLKFLASPVDWILRGKAVGDQEYFFIIGVCGLALLCLFTITLVLSKSLSNPTKVMVLGLTSVIASNVFGLSISQPDFWNLDNADTLVFYPHRQTFPMFLSLVLILVILGSSNGRGLLGSKRKILGLGIILGIGLLSHGHPTISNISPLSISPDKDRYFDTRWESFGPTLVSGERSCAPANPFPNFVGRSCGSELKSLVVGETTRLESSIFQSSSELEMIVIRSIDPSVAEVDLRCQGPNQEPMTVQMSEGFAIVDVSERRCSEWSASYVGDGDDVPLALELQLLSDERDFRVSE